MNAEAQMPIVRGRRGPNPTRAWPVTLGAWRGVALSMLAALGLAGCSTFAGAQTPAGRAGIPSHTRLLAPITKHTGCRVSR